MENNDFQWKNKENLWKTNIFDEKHKKTNGTHYFCQLVKTIGKTKKTKNNKDFETYKEGGELKHESPRIFVFFCFWVFFIGFR